MVWPPPKVQATAEGEASAETPGVALPQPLAQPGEPRSPARGWLEAPESSIGLVLGGRYRITGLLGRGPMGIACEGESSRGRQVTLKLLPRAPDLPLEHFAWQVRQTLALAHFDHAHVTPLTDFGSLEDGSAFVCRHRVPGVTLRTMLRQGGLPLKRALSIARQMASALEAAHAQDIAHGRLKPENVMIQGGAGPGDVVKVVDFGMSGLSVDWRAVARSENEARQLALRTRLYLPAEATQVNAATDVYSLGVILFEMLSGQPPFLSESIGGGSPLGARLSFSQLNPPVQVPRTVNDLVQGMMHPDAARQGLGARRIVELLDEMLGRASVAPSVPPPEARGSSPGEPRSTREPPPPPSQRGAPPARPAPMSFPPLPEGYAPSTLPPAPRNSEIPRSSSPAVGVASGTYPPAPPPSTVSDDDDTDFRPSFIGRLKRLFGRSKRDSGF
jgi:eukaryotic-like serine/threonine-protein kinase